MDKSILIYSASLSLFFIFIYTIITLKNKKNFDNGVIITLFFNSTGIIAGVMLALTVFYPEIRTKITDIDSYIFISGLVVLAVSIKGIYKDIKTVLAN